MLHPKTEMSSKEEKDPLLDEQEDSDIKEKKETTFYDRLKGFSAAFLAMTMGVTSTTSVQLLQRKIPDFELNTIRTAIALLSYSVVLLYRKESLLVPRSEILVTFCFCFLNFANSIGFYIAVTFIPVSSAEAIRITSGIASGLVIFALFGEETITITGFLCATCCISGVLIITQPPFLLSSGGKSLEITVTNTNIDSKMNDCKQIVGYVLPVLCGLVVSTGLLIAMKWPFLSQNKLKVFFWNFVLNFVISISVMAVFESPCFPQNSLEYILIFLHGSTFVIRTPLPYIAVQYISGNTFQYCS